MTETAQPRLPMAALISASLLSIGVGYASTAPYDAIIAIDALHIGHGDFALILTLASIVGVVASVALGWLSDRIGDRRLLMLATTLLGAVGMGLMYWLRSPMAFVIAYCVILPFGNSAFSQTFAYARVYYDQTRPKDAEFRITVLRSIYAASWVMVPPLAGWIAAVYQVFDVYLLAAAAYLVCGAISLTMLADPATRVVSAPPTPNTDGKGGIALPMLVGICGVLLINVAIKVSGTATPLAMVSHFGGNIGDVGIAAGIGALLEIPLMLAWGFLGRRFRKHTLIAAGALIYALYQVLLTQASGVTEVFWLQVPRAVAIAVLMSVPISYMQEAIRGRVGLSTSLLDVTVVASGMLSAGIFGLVAAPGRYLELFWVAAVLATCGAAVLLVAHNVLQRRPAVQH
ncbi:sugar efflux transporter [Devosia sp.]|uniref:sugar efflux transporter n=1 Tax=Devosia sp. TaxID=1871048 RepID=UPI003F706D7C